MDRPGTGDATNDYTRVKLISNPVKSFVCHNLFSNNNSTVRCKLDPQFIDIRRGVWQVAVSHVILINESDRPVNTVFDLTTNLSYTCQLVNHQPITVNECIASLATKCQKNEFVFYAPKTQNFFTVNDSSDHFILSLTRSKVFAKEAYSIKAEIRLLFQRML